MDVVGIDAWRGRWVALALRDGRYHRAALFETIESTLSAFPRAHAFAVDMPLGLPRGGEGRLADKAARAFVGPRGRSVFPVLPREVYEAEDYATARTVCQQLTGHSLSSQAYALRCQILELDALAAQRSDLREIHPEVSFRAMASRPLRVKGSWNGVKERLALLQSERIVLPPRIDELKDAGIEDVLDAAAAAWSAHRIASERAQSLPELPTQFVGQRPIAIWY